MNVLYHVYERVDMRLQIKGYVTMEELQRCCFDLKYPHGIIGKNIVLIMTNLVEQNLAKRVRGRYKGGFIMTWFVFADNVVGWDNIVNRKQLVKKPYQPRIKKAEPVKKEAYSFLDPKPVPSCQLIMDELKKSNSWLDFDKVIKLCEKHNVSVSKFINYYRNET